jgi:hypothetical protein
MRRIRRWYAKQDDDVQYSIECFIVAVFVMALVMLVITFYDKF